MANIVAEITNINQHLCALESTPERYKPYQCPHCSRLKLHCHGTYIRKAKCENDGRGIPVPRFFCPGCQVTCSTLPEFLPQRRWYHWLTQQVVLFLLISGASLTGAGHQLHSKVPTIPSRCTLQRWRCWLNDQFELHHFHLRTEFSNNPQYKHLCLTHHFDEFWCSYFSLEGRLSDAMFQLHKAGQSAP